jgi:hypothetical protein
MASNQEKKIFKHRPSTGWIWVTIIGLLPLLTGISLLISSGFSSPFILTIVITIPIGVGFLLLASFFPTMRYEMDGDFLNLTYGPLLRYTIDVRQIKSIRRRDLGFSIISSFRFPGLAIFNVPYPEIGNVKMCATAASNGILLIETDSTKYSLTPENEEDFVAELRKRMEQ